MAQQKWNLGDIRPPERPARRRRTMDSMTSLGPKPTRVDMSDMPDDVPEEEIRPRRTPMRTVRPRTWYIAIGIVGLIVLFLLTSLLFRRADLTVYPRFEDVTVRATFSALPNPSDMELGFEMLTIEEVGERTVPATGSEEVEERAEGELTIYNAYSEDTQRLIKNTRFESSDGKIFRVTDSVVVPGFTRDGDRVVPGQVVARVFADEAGESYNVPPGRFTVPGLEGTDQFEGMYAESSAPMTGGFIGTKLIVEENALASAQSAIQTELREKLLGRLQNERPAGFHYYEGAARITFESLPSTDAGASDATVREKGILSVPLFSQEDFARYIAQNTIAEYDGAPVRIDNPYALTFMYSASTSAEAAFRADNRIEFDLAGTARIVWDYDENALREAVAGRSRNELPTILAGYPAIQRANVLIRPFWKRSFPDSPEKIRIIEVIGEGSQE